MFHSPFILFNIFYLKRTRTQLGSPNHPTLSTSAMRVAIGPEMCLAFTSKCWRTSDEPSWFCCLMCITFANRCARSFFICCLYTEASNAASLARDKASASNAILFWDNWSAAILESVVSTSWVFVPVVEDWAKFSCHMVVFSGLKRGSLASTIGFRSSW